MFEKALYYPHIEIQNDRWLKSAALFWDRIETIVPESMASPYKRRTTRALEGEGILVAHRISPFTDDIREIELDVVKYLNTSEGRKSFRKPWYRSVVQGGDMARSDHFPDEFRRVLEDKYQDFFIHVDKLPLILRDKLADQKDRDGFVWAREGFMTFYMTLLANRICRNNDMALLTEYVTCNDLSNKIFQDRVSYVNDMNRQSKRAMIYQIVMDDIKIAPSTPIDDIIRFRKHRQQELVRFRNEMDKLTDFDTDGMNVRDLENEVGRIYKQFIIPAMNDVKATLKDARIIWLTGPVACMFSGILPTVTTMDLSTTTGIMSSISQGIALGLSSISVVNNWKAKRSPYTYLVKMRQEFSLAGKK